MFYQQQNEPNSHPAMGQSLQSDCKTAVKPSLTSRVQTGTRTTDLEHGRGREASQDKQGGRHNSYSFGGFPCIAQMLPYAAHHGKQGVNKNPGASETSRERLPNLRYA